MRHRILVAVGQRFGRLIVICDAPPITGKKFSKLHQFHSKQCQCDCGKTIVVRENSLKQGLTQSCGCLKTEMVRAKRLTFKCRLPPGKCASNMILKGYTQMARKRNHVWGLTIEQFLFLTTQPCFYCGAKPSQRMKPSRNGEFIYNGIDRVDNALGYTPENCVSACYICNRAKNTLSKAAFLEWVRRIYWFLYQRPKAKPDSQQLRLV